jgi:hypothetical protein
MASEVKLTVRRLKRMKSAPTSTPYATSTLYAGQPPTDDDIVFLKLSLPKAAGRRIWKTLTSIILCTKNQSRTQTSSGAGLLANSSPSSKTSRQSGMAHLQMVMSRGSWRAASMPRTTASTVMLSKLQTSQPSSTRLTSLARDAPLPTASSCAKSAERPIP